MARHRDQELVRVYSYAFYPEDIPPAIWQQFHWATLLWNELVAYEAAIDARYEALWNTVPAVAKAKADLATWRAHKHDGDSAAQDGQDTEFARLLRIVADTKNQHHEALKTTLREFWQQITDERRTFIKTVRQRYAAQGLRYGTYNDVIRRYNQARQKVLARRKAGRFARLHERSDDLTGVLTLQVVPQKGKPPLTWATLTRPGNHPFWNEVRMAMPQIHPESTRSDRRHKNRTAVQVRLASTIDHDPIWLKGAVALHRVWPDDGIITTIRWVRRRSGGGIDNTLQFTVREPIVSQSEPRPRQGIVIQMTGLPNPSAVASWVSDTEASMPILLNSVESIRRWTGEGPGVLMLPAQIVRGLDQVAAIQKTRDQARIAIQRTVAVWLGAHRLSPTGEDALPFSSAQVSRWRTTDAVVALLNWWRGHRQDGDTAMYNALEAWHKQDRRWTLWQSGLRSKSLRFRREIYRTFAARLCELFESVWITTPPLRSPTDFKEIPRHSRALSYGASSIVKSDVQWALAKQGRTVQILDDGLNLICPHCGGQPSWAESPTIRCLGCGVAYDATSTAWSQLQQICRGSQEY